MINGNATTTETRFWPEVSLLVSRKMAVVLAAISYVITSIIIFGHVLRPMAIILTLNDRLDFQYWKGPLLAGVLIGGLAAFLFCRQTHSVFGAAVFVAVSMYTCITLTEVLVERAREDAILKFQPDRVTKNSFWRSLIEPTGGSQLFLHAAAMKGCKSYAWSYRLMGFYLVPSRIARNVMPPEWLIECELTINF